MNLLLMLDLLKYFFIFPVQFNDSFIRKTLAFLGKNICNDSTLASRRNALNTLLKEKQDIVSDIQKAIVEKLLKMLINCENIVEVFVPYKILKSEFSSDNMSLYEMMEELKEKRKKTYSEIVDKCLLIMNRIFIGSFIDTYAIASLAFTD